MPITILPKLLKITLLLFMLAVIVAFYLGGGADFFDLSNLQEQQQNWNDLYKQYQLLFFVGFFILYVFMTAFSIPAASILTLFAGSIFGFSAGLLLVSFASSIGATLAFWMARFLLGDELKQRFSEQLPRFHQGFADEGNFYLFALRLVPVFPFFMVNLIMGLLPISSWRYYWVSQLGMLPGTAVYVYAGTELGKIRQLADIASPSLLLAFALLGILPLISKKAIALWRTNDK